MQRINFLNNAKKNKQTKIQTKIQTKKKKTRQNKSHY